ncbi:MAG TPA: helicase-associated domain-containing protein, partial [Rectinemataceae bacterium]|nr:helicase-associated domain-containing protein [Rectinemataceae bacterium]
MNDVIPTAGRMAQWRDSMLSESSVRLLALARNYLGHVGSMVDKGKIVSGLSAMVARPEIQSAALALMDRTDKLIVGIISVAGDMDKAALQKMLAGEISYHEMEYRLANLTERLILFQTREETFALNPLFDETARSGAARIDILFGPGPAPAGVGSGQGQAVASAGVSANAATNAATAPAAEVGDFGREGPPPALLSVQELGLIAYSLLQENRNLFLKSGELSARAKKRIASLLRGDREGVGIVEAIIHALYRAGMAQEEDRGPLVDFRAFADFLLEAGRDFPFAMCLAYVNGLKSNPYALIAEASFPFFEHRFSFSEAGLGRFIRLALGDSVVPETICSIPAALKDFGLLKEKDGLLQCSPERIVSRWPVSSFDDHAAISVEGTGMVHVLPSASLRDTIALLDIGSLESASGAWSVSITRESSRRTFAAGWTAGDIERSLESMSGTAIPQTLRFDIARWEEEYNSIRLFRGYVLAADGRAAKIIEGSGALSRFPH